MDDEQRFADQISHSYGQVEAALGAEGYKVMLEAQKKSNLQATADIDRTLALTTAIRVAVLILLVMSIPVQVVLWKWAWSF